ncbi:MAG: GntR family transcriptional regulator [Eggerthellaceae bacterium]|nr:GntR family transcriptional regulator [Eggerthellaceae bacterium]
MELLIANASDKPIYAQIAQQIQDAILSGELTEGEALPSIRSLANDLRISVITTKRAYAELEEAGFIDTVQGKGSFVAGGNRELLREGRLKRVEELLAQAIQEAAAADISRDELHAMLDALLDEEG